MSSSKSAERQAAGKGRKTEKWGPTEANVAKHITKRTDGPPKTRYRSLPVKTLEIPTKGSMVAELRMNQERTLHAAAIGGMRSKGDANLEKSCHAIARPSGCVEAVTSDPEPSRKATSRPEIYDARNHRAQPEGRKNMDQAVI